MRMRGTRSAVMILATVALVAAACSSNSDTTSSSAGSGELSASLNISGSSTVLPITTLATEAFHDANPGVNPTVDGPGTGDGFVLFCEGKTDINDASRQIEDEEAKACEKAGINYIGLEIGLDGITVMTNPANSTECLDLGDLYALFGPQSEGIDNWADANGLATKVGGKGGFPDLPLTITAPGEESGTYDSFIDLAGIEDTALEQGVPEDEAASLRSDYNSSPNDNVIVQGVEGEDGGLGFVGFAYADQQGGNVTKLQIDGGDGCVEPSSDTISDGSYPLSRSLYIYVNTDKAASNPALKAFVDYYLSDEGITSVTDADYVAIPQERLDASRQSWESAAVGGASGSPSA
jgi:phosphate transport system substrate-binding protein